MDDYTVVAPVVVARMKSGTVITTIEDEWGDRTELVRELQDVLTSQAGVRKVTLLVERRGAVERVEGHPMRVSNLSAEELSTQPDD